MTQGGHSEDFHKIHKIDPLLLQRAIEKPVLFGQQVGVTPEEMISIAVWELRLWNCGEASRGERC
jgi:hypothetical protein